MNNFGKDQLNMTEFNPEDVSDPITGDASGFNPDAYNDGGLGGDISSLYLPNIPTTSSTFEYAPTQPPQDQPHSQQQQQQQQQQQPPPPPPQAPFQQDYQPQESLQYYMYEGGSNNNTYSQQDYNNMDCATYGTEMKVTTEEDDLRRCMLEIEYNSIKTFKEYNKISDDVTVEDEMGRLMKGGDEEVIKEIGLLARKAKSLYARQARLEVEQTKLGIMNENI